MNRAGEAWVKGMNDPEQLDWIVRIGNRGSDECLFDWAVLFEVVFGRSIPVSRCNNLVTVDARVGNGNPVAKSASWCFGEAYA